MTTPRERDIELRQLTLRAQVWGDPALPALLALHGWLDNAASMALLAPKLVKNYHVIALELPGHGHSAHLPAGAHYHFIDYVRTVFGVLDALAIERCELLGHSLGAGIATLVAAVAPQRIQRLWLIEGLGPLGDDGTQTLSRFRAGLTARADHSKPQRVFRDIDQAVSARTLASGLPANLARPIVERGLIETTGGWRWRSDPRLTLPSPLRLAESQIHALLHGIETPTQMLLAEPATVYLPAAAMQTRAACVAGITTRQMAGGHHLQLEHPTAVADWITLRE